jgi:superfamily II DNA/RNA helicase
VGTDDCAHALVNLPQVSLIINYDLPNHRDLYVRRISRLSGHGCIGVVINFVMEQDTIRILNDLEQYYETQVT